MKVFQSCLNICDPIDYTVHGILQARMDSLSLLQGIFATQGSNPGWADSLPAEPQGKTKNIGVGNLFLLQWIFLTQEDHAERTVVRLVFLDLRIYVSK